MRRLIVAALAAVLTQSAARTPPPVGVLIGLSTPGTDYAMDSWRINEHSNVTADGPPVYHFKTMIPIAGALVMMQGVAEIVRCIVCLKTGEWPSRLNDVAEIDVIGEQLANSEFVSEEDRKIAIERAAKIDEEARQRGMGSELQS